MPRKSKAQQFIEYEINRVTGQREKSLALRRSVEADIAKCDGTIASLEAVLKSMQDAKKGSTDGA